MKNQEVKIGYRTYKIKFVKSIAGGRHIGEHEEPLNCENYKGTIRIMKGLDPTEEANTIMHELLHAFFYAQAIGLKSKEEERVVSALANAIVGFTRENPKFMLKLIKLALKE